MKPSTENSDSRENHHLHFDIIIVGGGMVGLSVAAGLAEHYKIAVIDSAKLTFEFPKKTETRVSAITRASENWLKSLNAWQQIPQQKKSSYRQMKVWDSSGNGKLEFSAQQVAEPNIGHIIENSVIQCGLLKSLQRLIEKSQIQLFDEQKVAQMLLDKDQTEVVLTNGERLSSRLIVAADGANSWVRKQLGFIVTSESYQQGALVALIKSQKSHQRTAWQRFLPSGPLAFLPMKQQNCHSIVWSLDDDLLDSALVSDVERFERDLEKAIEHQFGSLELISKRVAFPLVAKHAASYVQNRVVLVGDAAHNIHPLAGQGVNLGFKDAKALVTVLKTVAEVAGDPGNKRYLRQYERARKGDNLKVQKAMSLLKQGFANEQQILATLRNLGMNVVNQQDFVKKRLIQSAMDIS